MGLISTEVEVNINKIEIAKFFQNKGYDVPLCYSKKLKKWICKRNTLIKVNPKDLYDYSKAIIEVQCDMCGKKYNMLFQGYRSNTELHNGYLYCHQCCSRMLMGGDKHYLWNPNKTTEQRILERGIPENIDFRKKVMARDNYKCILCGCKGNDVHHLNSYHAYPEQRFDVPNGITLCKNHHRAFHCWQQQEYGFDKKGYCTKEQFEKWSNLSINIKDYNEDLPISKCAVCLETKEIIGNIQKYAKDNNLQFVGIYACCNHKFKEYKGKHYLSKKEYDKMSELEISEYIKNNYTPTYAEMFGENVHNSKKVVCVTYKTAFVSMKSAAKYYSINRTLISGCCYGKYLKTKIKKEKTQWMFYEDYIKQYGKENLTFVDIFKEITKNNLTEDQANQLKTKLVALGISNVKIEKV